MRVERLRRRGNGRDAVARQRRLQLALGQLDAAGQSIEARVRRPRVLVHAVQRPAQVVRNRQDVAGEAADGILAGVVAIAGGDAADVLRFRQRPLPLFAQLGDLGFRPGQPLGQWLLFARGFGARRYRRFRRGLANVDLGLRRALQLVVLLRSAHPGHPHPIIRPTSFAV